EGASAPWRAPSRPHVAWAETPRAALQLTIEPRFLPEALRVIAGDELVDSAARAIVAGGIDVDQELLALATGEIAAMRSPQEDGPAVLMLGLSDPAKAEALFARWQATRKQDAEGPVVERDDKGVIHIDQHLHMKRMGDRLAIVRGAPDSLSQPPSEPRWLDADREPAIAALPLIHAEGLLLFDAHYAGAYRLPEIWHGRHRFW